MRAKNALVKTWPYAYPVVLERDLEGGTWAGFTLDLPVFAWGKPDREALLRSLREGLALALLELEEGRPLPTPSASVQVPPEVAEGEVVLLEPAPVSVRICRFLPLTFFAPSYPRGPLFLARGTLRP